MPFSKIFPSSRSLNLVKKGLESPGKVLYVIYEQRELVFHRDIQTRENNV